MINNFVKNRFKTNKNVKNVLYLTTLSVILNVNNLVNKIDSNLLPT
jgi:hypothetical protein